MNEYEFTLCLKRSDDIFIFRITQSKMNRFLLFLVCRILMTYYGNANKLVHHTWKRHTTLWNADLFHLTEVRLALPSKKRWQHTATSVLWNNILSLLQIKMLFTVSHAIKTLTSAEAMFKMSPLALDASTKMGAPLLHCSINDTLISRILRCQNMFTKLIKRSWFDVCTGL